jgi:hypothetical protein
MNRLSMALVVITTQAEDALTSVVGLRRGLVETNHLASTTDRLILMKLAAIALILSVVWIAWRLPSPAYRMVATAAIMGSVLTFVVAVRNASL